MKVNRTVLIALLSLNVVGCGATVETSNNRRIANAANATQTVSPTNSKVKTGRGFGVVLSVDAANSTVELKHQEIKLKPEEKEVMMPAMEMMFDVRDKSQLQNLKQGDKVEFTLEENENREEKIIQIAPVR